MIYAEPLKKFTKSAKMIAGKIFENFIKMLRKYTVVEEVKYFLPDEIQGNIGEQMEEATSVTTCDEEHVPSKKIIKLNRVPFDTKLKIMTVNEHPNWSFTTLQKRFKQHLHHNSAIA